jgi:glutamate-1-semialdehyde 2,1-aminomutase
MARLHAGLLAEGINIVPRGLWFLSTAHTDEQIDETLAVTASVLAGL